MTNLPPDSLLAEVNRTTMGRMFRHIFGHESSTTERLILIVMLAILVHVMVKVIRSITEWVVNKSHTRKVPLGFVTQEPKFITLIQLVANTAISIMYFFAFGLVLEEFGVNLTAYLASASIVGLAISFGSQGMVQDMVIGLTLIFSDALDVGDLVEIAGAVVVVGRVDEIGLRFTKLVNLYNQKVFIPNRTIANVSRFPLGGVDAYADVQIPLGAETEKVAPIVANIAAGMWAQFGAIIFSEPVVDPVVTAPGGGWSFIRVRFKIWPGQGSLIEITFRQQIVSALKAFNAGYADWQIPVTYRAMTVTKLVNPTNKPSGDKPVT